MYIGATQMNSVDNMRADANKNINHKLTKTIKEKLAKGESICNIISDILEFESGMDVYDILEQIPDHLVTTIKKELAEKKFKIAEKEFPGLKNELLDENSF